VPSVHHGSYGTVGANDMSWVSTVNGVRRIKDARSVVHVVNMRHCPPGRGKTFCGEKSWLMSGTWLDPDASATCLGCLGAMP